MFSTLPHRSILGTRVHCSTYGEVCHLIVAAIQQEIYGYVAIANVHMVMTGVWQTDFQHIINQSLVTTADGMPLVWGLKQLGLPQATRVYGPDLMLHCCALAAEQQIPIYLYGSRPATLAKLQENLRHQFPDLPIAGMEAPPFRPLTPTETQQTITNIKQSGAKLVFVGLGCPKQERWMSENTAQLPAILLGVGAAFDFHAGTIAQAPRWMMQFGLEWFYRLLQEPRRLWKRYVINNSVFIVLFGWQLLRRRSPREKISQNVLK